MRIVTKSCAVLAVLGTGHGALAVEVRYHCKDGSNVAAKFKNDSVVLKFGGKSDTIVLPQVPSADGGRFAENNIELWIKGKGARLTRAGTVTTCQS